MNEVFKNIIECLETRQKEHLANMEMVSGIYLRTIHEARASEIWFAIEFIKQVAREYNNGWIPASQPPEINKRDDGKTDIVIVQLKNGEINIGTYKQDGFYSMCREDQRYVVKNDNVVYWQAFPRPIEISDTWKQQTMSRFERIE